MKPTLFLAVCCAVMISLRSVAPDCLAGDCSPIERVLVSLPDKPLYQSNEKELDAYLRDLHSRVSDYRQRMMEIARKNIDQPYELYLLGEAPFEAIDNQPIYCLGKSDCVVFAEHALAMSLAKDFPSFVRLLQRIRYKDGAIGVLTRNHYTEADWNKNNAWLVTEITDQIAGDDVKKFTLRVDRQKFFRSRYKLETQIPVQVLEETFIPHEKVGGVKSKLRAGDIVNFVSGRNGGYWVGHVGMVALGANGEVNLIHSASPKVREERIEDYIARATADAAEKDAASKSRFHGFKFLRPVDNPLARLAEIDGKDAPRISVPKESKITFDDYLRTLEKQEISQN